MWYYCKAALQIDLITCLHVLMGTFFVDVCSYARYCSRTWCTFLCWCLLREILFKDLLYAFMLTFVVMRDTVQGLGVRFCVDVCYARYCSRTYCTLSCWRLLLCGALFKDLVYVFLMRDIVQGLSVRFCVDFCCYARYCSRTWCSFFVDVCYARYCSRTYCTLSCWRLLLCEALFKDLVYVFLMRDIVQELSVRFCVDFCCYARYCSRT